VRAALRFLAAEKVEAVAICFLFSFLNDAHEKRAAEIAREMLSDCFVSARTRSIRSIGNTSAPARPR
jgi:N-methylhydantoinase A